MFDFFRKVRRFVVEVIQASCSSQAEDISSIENNFIKSLKSVYYISRAYGFFPFSVVFNSAGEVQHAQVKVFDLISFAISICVYSIVIYFYITNMFITFIDVENILNLSCSISLVFQLLLIPVVIVMNMYKSKSIGRCFERIL